MAVLLLTSIFFFSFRLRTSINYVVLLGFVKCDDPYKIFGGPIQKYDEGREGGFQNGQFLCDVINGRSLSRTSLVDFCFLNI